MRARALDWLIDAIVMIAYVFAVIITVAGMVMILGIPILIGGIAVWLQERSARRGRVISAD